MNDFIPYQMISASAGSGKTFQLSSRYIRLLGAGVDPATIVALTFTRKAAAEIFDRIMQRLALAALDPIKLRELNETTALSLDTEQARTLLQSLIRAMPMLRIGTLDSFFARVVRLFAYELGLQGEFGILEGFALEEAREEALRRTLSTNLSETERKEFHLHFKQATFGREERGVLQKLDAFMKEFHPILQAAPNGVCWGNPARIWPDGQPLLNTPEITRADYDAALETLSSLAGDKSWTAFLTLLRAFDGNRLPEGSSTLFNQLLEQCPEWDKCAVELKLRNNPYALTTAHRNALDAVVRFLFQRILLNRCQRTQGLFNVLHRYEQNYAQTIRRAGRISFQDITLLLAAGAIDAIRSPLRLTQEPIEASDERLYIDYRLDGRFDHWMLDEFQDTSTNQWAILGNLIDEVLQGNTAERSFFYVGDVKQAIYGWRGGDARLFTRIYDRYAPAIQKETLALSRRSSPAVIQTVNAVFSNLRPEERLPEKAITRWNESWSEHGTVRQDAPGYAAFYELPAPEKNNPDPFDPRFALTADLIEPMLKNPPPNGIAILVRSAKAGLAVVDCLRARGINTLWEGDTAIADNTVVSALLSLLKLAEHPGDELAWQHLQMTPLRGVMNSFKMNRSTLSTHLLRDIHLNGFQHLLQRWTDECERLNSTAFSPFTRARLAQLQQCAQEFDLAHPRQVIPFIRFVQQTTGKAEAPAGAVRVLTMHKAKGLEFDAVFLPDLQDSSLDSLGHGELGLVHHTEPENPDAEWVLHFPPMSFAETDATLCAELRDQRDRQVYESLCLLYVAITRAREALYLITHETGKNSKAFYAATLLKKQLDGKSGNPCSDPRLFYEIGTPDWNQTIRRSTETPPLEPTVPAPTQPEHPPATRLERRLPSAEADARLRAEHLFSARGRAAADYGTAMHALFEQLEWYTPGIETTCLAHLEPLPLDEDIKANLRREFAQTLKNQTICNALAKPLQAADLWREKHFEIALGSRWISGCFDRVTILLDETRKPVAATILDYKTDQFADTPEALAQAVESHRSQLELYREVLAVMTALPPEQITLQLLFTHHAKLSQWRA
ncbi:MAG: UvrD-helicase domain-containing protein [Kiritimatiellae bacterium]|nr:UvrD-helicase domain-containing protein [Kiritimatiellia bacterium]